jgi:hypothetical protein
MKNKWFGVFLIVALLAGALLVPDVRSFAQSTVTTFTNLKVKNSATISNDLTVTDTVAVGNDLTVTDDATIASALNLTPGTVVTITQSATLVPNGSLQPIASAGAVSFGVITAPSNGNVLLVVNTGAQTITISETASIVTAGNLALGSGDTVLFAYIGTKYYQMAPIGNN